MTVIAPKTPATVLIAGDQGVLGAGLRSLFARYPYLKVVGEAARGNEALRLAQELVPDLVLLDIDVRELAGIAVTEALGRALPAVRVLLLTANEDVDLLRAALRAGASGFIVKSATEAELMSAIAAVLRGDLYLDPSVTRALLPQPALPARRTESDAYALLTPRETDVMRLVGDGCTNAQIARALGINIRTVETHRAHLIEKLGTNDRADIVRLAVAFHLVRTAKLKPKSQ